MAATVCDFDGRFRGVVDRLAELAGAYGISSIGPLVESCRALAGRDEISVGVLGRFKAGKSSFLNDFLQDNLLPVGAVPVTGVVTEVVYGPELRALVMFIDGHVEQTPIDGIESFISENKNPENQMRVSRVTVEVPRLKRFAGLRFVDTPGLRSVLAHNTAASLEWLPSAGVALVAMSADTPLSQDDVELLRELCRHTPHVSILLTKADLLSESELAEVASFIGAQLAKVVNSALPVFPYSIRPGYEHFRANVEAELIEKTLHDFQLQRSAIAQRKLTAALAECAAYLNLALACAQALDSERFALKNQLVGDKNFIDDVRSEIHLVIRHATAGTRTDVARVLETHQAELRTRLTAALAVEFPNWTSRLAQALGLFETWLRESLSKELEAISARGRSDFVAPLERVSTQVLRRLQGFRDELSQRALRAFGVPLRTTEVEIGLQEPASPDIRVGHVFDRNWELLSFITPMSLVKGIVRRHFTRKIPDVVEVNLSRLASQWTQSLNCALAGLEITAQRRIDEVVETVERLLASSHEAAPQIREDLAEVAAIRAEMSDAAR